MNLTLLGKTIVPVVMPKSVLALQYTQRKMAAEMEATIPMI